MLVVAVTCHQDHQDAVHITAILGESVVFNCQVDFPEDTPVPYVLQWEKKGQDIPIYIWYESYPTHSGEGYEGRVSRVAPDSPYGAASLNLTNIRESDQGWYECKVVFLNRSPNQHKNGTWFHLDVHAPPRFSITPEDIIYVNLGDAIILNCQAEGTPTPEILWYKDANPVEPSGTVGIFNDGTELRISNIRHEDIGDYTCIARNGEGQVSHTARVIIAGGAMPPTNQTKLEGEKVQFSCEAKALPGNVTVKWFREGAPVAEVAALETRVTIRRDGALVINPVAADDSGQYLCEVSNGIGDPQSASAYLNVEYPAKVTFTPTVQYLPFRLAGVVQCYIKANPPLQYVTWTKDKRLLEPYQTKDIVIMNNGSLLFTRVNQNHQGRYTCTPYNAQGTQGSSGPMEVLVRKPPVFTVEPEPLYQRKVGESVEMHCEAQEAEGTQRPSVVWRRRDGLPLQKNRVRALGGNITIETLRRQDFGIYQCVASNEVATIVADTQLVIEGTQPHAPYNVSGTATEFSVTLRWQPGYAGGPDYKQDYTIWYREAGYSEWTKVPVTPSGATSVTINRLQPGTTYEFQVNSKNTIGEGMMSKAITIRTLDVGARPKAPASSPGPPDEKKFITAAPETGPRPGNPRNLTVTELHNGFLISWQPPLERVHLVQYYTIKYRTDAQWKTLNRGQIRSEETSYLGNYQVCSQRLPDQLVQYYTIKYRTDAQWKTLNRGQIRSEETSYLGNYQVCSQRLPDQLVQYYTIKYRTDAQWKTLNRGQIRSEETSYLGNYQVCSQRLPDQLVQYYTIKYRTDAQWKTLNRGQIRSEETSYLVEDPQPRADPLRGDQLSRLPDQLVQYYTIKYRTDAQWKTLNRGQIRSEETSYLVKNLVGGRTYYFRVLANSASSYESSDEVKFAVPARVKHKAITAGVVGGILFFIVAIILSVCAVKICNKRKRRKQEKAYNMVAARLTDLRAADSTQVPFKKFRESGISSIVQCLKFTANWVWPASRCGGEPAYWAHPPPPSLADSTPAPSPAPSSSDDGGFLPRVRAPLQPAAAPPLFRASSPARALHWPPWPPWPPWAAAWAPWSPLHVSDLSSVPFPSSGDGSFPSFPTPPSPFRLRALPAAPLTLRSTGPFVRTRARHGRPRAISELPPPPHEASPESRSSSSGFGSKNASSQHNRSSRTGSLAEWRPPPYRAPPPAPPPRPGSGSVDVHYEWDRATRTPTPSTPERPRARDRTDVEARVRAMKEEFLDPDLTYTAGYFEQILMKHWR
ncbi:immunoglobulin domain-containing protein [Phthorimaea operculella]|nr:immunoglobulin domain-containing protein [Phthorimaea operculella]